jgi:hypothetical protein
MKNLTVPPSKDDEIDSFGEQQGKSSAHSAMTVFMTIRVSKKILVVVR